MLGKTKKLHFVGIGGIGMSGIAEVLLNLGFQISGSDLLESDIIRHLQEKGAQIAIGHALENVQDPDVIVISSAVNDENPEVVAAKQKKIPIIRRAEMLAELMRMKVGIGIAGTHGKTTTTSMVGLALTEGGLDPTIVVGGKIRSLESNAVLGQGKYLVAEADEFDRSFLRLTPTISVITNIEADHLDCYENLEDIQQAFITFANSVPFYGTNIICLDDHGIQRVLPFIDRNILTYGFSAQADLRAKNVRPDGFRSFFEVQYHNETLGEVQLNLPGEHNIKNALAAIGVGLELDVPFATIAHALSNFRGVWRRFELLGEANGITVLDDYAHHPTEIEATLKGLRSGTDRKIIAIFQPHLYSRTRDFYQDFGKSFYNADLLVVTDIYPAREMPIAGVTGRLVADAATQFGHRNVEYVPDKNTVPEAVKQFAEPGDIVITIGAGDIYKFGQKLLEIL